MPKVVIDDIEIEFDSIKSIPEENAVEFYKYKDNEYMPSVRMDLTHLSDFGRRLLCQK